MTIFEWILSRFKKKEEDEEKEVEEYLKKYAKENGFGDLYKEYSHVCEEIIAIKKEIAENVQKGNKKATSQLRDELSLETKKWQKLNRSLKDYVAKHKK